jgi:hypothetical protein
VIPGCVQSTPEMRRSELVNLLAAVIIRPHVQPSARIPRHQNVEDFSHNCLDEPQESSLTVHSGLHLENLGEPK